MYYFLALLSGVLISVMVVINGFLTAHYGLYSATVIIHIVGLLFILAVAFLKKKKIGARGLAWYLFTGGAIGVATTVFNNLAFGRISVSAILALGLLAQMLSGLLIDQFGLLGMPRHPFRLEKTAGILIVGAGIGVMMQTGFELTAVIVSFLTGITIIVSRSVNAKLSQHTNVYAGTVYNYIIGLPVAVLVCIVLGGGEPARTGVAFSGTPYLYLGGILGVLVVLLSNITVMRISAFYMSLLSFVGQILSSVLLDAALDGAFSGQILLGGVLVSAGMCLNLLLDRRQTAGAKTQQMRD